MDKIDKNLLGLSVDVLEIDVTHVAYSEYLGLFKEFGFVFLGIIAVLFLLFVGIIFVCGFSLNSFIEALLINNFFINNLKEAIGYDIELTLLILLFVGMFALGVFGTIYYKFFYFKSNSLKTKKITFSDKGIKIIQQKKKYDY